MLAAVSSHFPPEFINRLDDQVIFAPLSRSNLRAIVRLQMGAISARLASRQITVDLTDSAVDAILAACYSPLYGARPVKRYLQKKVATQISRLIVTKAVASGCVLRIDADADGVFEFGVENTAVAVAVPAATTSTEDAENAGGAADPDGNYIDVYVKRVPTRKAMEDGFGYRAPLASNKYV